MTTNRQQIIFFDVDDTLYDHTYCARAGLRSLIEGLAPFRGLDLDQLHATYSRLLEESHSLLLAGEMNLFQSSAYRWRRLVDTVAGDSSIDSASVALRYRSEYMAHERAVPGVPKLLKLLKKDFRIGVITNNLIDEQIGKLTRLGIIGEIEVLTISEAVGFAKPDPRIFQFALEAACVNATDALMIGDSWSSDIQGAEAIGMKAIWFRPSMRSEVTNFGRVLSSFEPVETVANYIRNEITVPMSTSAEPEIS